MSHFPCLSIRYCVTESEAACLTFVGPFVLKSVIRFFALLLFHLFYCSPFIQNFLLLPLFLAAATFIIFCFSPRKPVFFVQALAWTAAEISLFINYLRSHFSLFLRLRCYVALAPGGHARSLDLSGALVSFSSSEQILFLLGHHQVFIPASSRLIALSALIYLHISLGQF